MAITKDEIVAKCSAELIASRDCEQIAAQVSAGRTKPNGLEVGVGTILETIGLVAGNEFLDALYGDSRFRYVKPLIEQGRLVVSSPLVVGTINSMVPSILTQGQAIALVNLGLSPAPVSAQEVAAALFNLDASEK